MKLWVLIATALLAMTMAGCVLRGKPKAAIPAAPSPAAATEPLVKPAVEPLSVPQTQVKLWPQQPLDPQALVVESPPQSPPPAAAAAQPSAPATRRPPAAASAPKPDPLPVAPAEPARPSIEEVLPERSQLQEKVAASQKRIRAWLETTTAQRLTGQAKLTRDRIQSFLKASDEAERVGDLREAVQLAERAEILMRELQGGR